jgi:hypothetical protein
MGYKLKILEPNFELKLFLIDELWCVPEQWLGTLRTNGPDKVERLADGQCGEGSYLQGE